MSSLIFAAADVDPVILFVLAVGGFVCGIVGVFQSWPGISVVAAGLICISLAGMLAWWP